MEFYLRIGKMSTHGIRERIIAYIDGFNLYFGLKSKNWKCYYWLDIPQLAKQMLLKHQKLASTKYFTARIKAPHDKVVRQNTFIEALQTLPNLMVIEGKYQFESRTCYRCGKEDNVPREKMTDVNIAVEMLADAFEDKYDTAMLVSADSDLSNCVKRIPVLFPNKKVITVFPPNRHSEQLKDAAAALPAYYRAPP